MKGNQQRIQNMTDFTFYLICKNKLHSIFFYNSLAGIYEHTFVCIASFFFFCTHTNTYCILT